MLQSVEHRPSSQYLIINYQCVQIKNKVRENKKKTVDTKHKKQIFTLNSGELFYADFLCSTLASSALSCRDSSRTSCTALNHIKIVKDC